MLILKLAITLFEFIHLVWFLLYYNLIPIINLLTSTIKRETWVSHQLLNHQTCQNTPLYHNTNPTPLNQKLVLTLIFHCYKSTSLHKDGPRLNKTYHQHMVAENGPLQKTIHTKIYNTSNLRRNGFL